MHSSSHSRNTVVHVLQDIRNSKGNKVFIYLFHYDGLSHHPDHDMLPIVVNGIRLIRIHRIRGIIIIEEEVEDVVEMLEEEEEESR